MSLLDRRNALLRWERETLLADMTRWRHLTTNDPKWQKHYSQVRRVADVLEQLLADAWGAAENCADQEYSASMHRDLLFAQRIWDYFRSKIALRDHKELRPVLQCADEFAWSCYYPAWEKARQAQAITPVELKEPPLVYLTGSETPFIQVRQGRYLPEGIGSGDALRYGNLLALPVPIIGMPWSLVRQAALIITLAHEVGHAVDEDFNAGEIITGAIRGITAIPSERRQVWLAWRRELFADAYAVLCTGPAYPIALSDYLTTSPESVWMERVDPARPGKYPPRQLRMLFNVKLAAAAGLADIGMWNAWEEQYPIRGMQGFDEYAADIPHMVHALMDTPIPKFGGKSLQDVVCMTPQEWSEVERRADNLPVVDDRLPWFASQFRQSDETRALFRVAFAAVTLASYRAVDPAAKARQAEHIFEKATAWVPYGKRGPFNGETADALLYDAQQASLADAVAQLRRVISEGQDNLD